VRLVEDRQRDRCRSRVELAQIDDRALVLRGRAAVGGSLAHIPLARGARGVVEAHVLDRELADLPAGLLERHLLAVDDGLRLRAGVALQREAGINGQRGAARAGAASSAATTAVVV